MPLRTYSMWFWWDWTPQPTPPSQIWRRTPARSIGGELGAIDGGKDGFSGCSDWIAQTVKNLPALQETQVSSLGWEDPLEKGMATHSSILAWRIPWTEEPGGLQSMELQRVGHHWETNTFTFHFSGFNSVPVKCMCTWKLKLWLVWKQLFVDEIEFKISRKITLDLGWVLNIATSILTKERRGRFLNKEAQRRQWLEGGSGDLWNASKSKKKKKERKKPRISAKHKKLGEMHGMHFSSEPLEGINPWHLDFRLQTSWTLTE